MRTLIIGSPRSGTQSASAHQADLSGQRCGHEEVASWNAAREGVVDWGELRAESSWQALTLLPLMKAEKIIAVVRNPADIAVSIASNGILDSMRMLKRTATECELDPWTVACHWTERAVDLADEVWRVEEIPHRLNVSRNPRLAVAEAPPRAVALARRLGY